MQTALEPHIFQMSKEVEKELNRLRFPPHNSRNKRLEEKTNFEFYNDIANILDGRYNKTAMPLDINQKITQRRAEEIAASLGADYAQYDYYKDIAKPIGQLLGPKLNAKAATTHTSSSITNSKQQSVGDVLKKGQFMIVVYPRGATTSYGPTDYQFEIIMKTEKKNIKRITNNLSFPSPTCYVLEREGGFRENVSGNFRQKEVKDRRFAMLEEQRAIEEERYKEEKAKRKAAKHREGVAKHREAKKTKKARRTSSEQQNEDRMSKPVSSRMNFSNLISKVKR